MPAIGLGTFGSGRFSGQDIAAAVLGAAEVGYRHFDCAAMYGNEDLIGESFQAILKGGIPREELFIVSKLRSEKHREADVIPACRATLEDLQLDYLDLYLVHWPFRLSSPSPNAMLNSKPQAEPYQHEKFMETWRQMEKLVDLGLVKHIGTSNMSVAKLDPLLKDAHIKPAANQMELHPHFQQEEFFDYLNQNRIAAIGYCPLGSPTRPDANMDPNDTVDLEDREVVKIAKRLNVHPAIVCIKWAMQRGQTPIPFSIFRNEYLSNIRGAVSPPLTDEDMKVLSQVDKNCRLVKGYMYMSEEQQHWKEVWDDL
jgi:alcohol dehydrogenase (NADP+)